MAKVIEPPDSAPIDPIKSGVSSSEFWLSAVAGLAGIVAQYSDAIPAPWGFIAATALAAIYTCARAYVKGKAIDAKSAVDTAEAESR